MILAFRSDVGSLRTLIARVTGRPVHVACVFGETLIEADTKGVVEVQTTARLSTGQWTCIPVPNADDDKALRWLRTQVGARYDWWGVLYAWWGGRRAGSGARHRWFCSELAAEALQRAGIQMPITRSAAYTPRRLYDTVKHWAAVLLMMLPMVAGAQPSTALPKPCWPEDALKGRDTAYAAFPCNDLRALPVGMRVQVECTVERLKKGGWDPLVFETWRSKRRVAYLFSFGRTRPGRKVTNASNALNAPHYWGYGVDIIHRTRKWDHPRFFQWLGQHYEACGLAAGAFWRSFPDFPHGQFAMYESERQRPALVARLMREGKRDSVWLVSGAVR